MAKKRKREVTIHFYVSENELNSIKVRMQEANISNLSMYLRKVAIDGYIITQDFSDLRKIVYELGKLGTNVNQIAKVANTYGVAELYKDDIEGIRKELAKICHQLELFA